MDFINLEDIQLTEYENIEENTINRIDLINKIKQLDNRTQEIIFMKVTGEMTFKEIGEILGISEVVARVTFYRGKQKIKEVGNNEEK